MIALSYGGVRKPKKTHKSDLPKVEVNPSMIALTLSWAGSPYYADAECGEFT